MLALLMVAGLVAPAAADPLALPKDPQALEHLKLGNRQLDLGRLDEAITEYEAGALRDPMPVFWLNIGLAHWKAGRHAPALDAYRTFLLKIADEPDAEELRAEVEEVIRKIEEDARRDPEPHPDVDGAGIVAVQPESPSTFTKRRKVAIGIAGVGVIAVAAGGVLGFQSRDLRREAATICPAMVCNEADRANEIRDRAKTRALQANVALGLGVIAVGTAAVLWVTGAPGGRSETPRVGPAVAPGFAGIRAMGRF
jgi:tetratricopeptide (TPR) repeat protein